MPGRPRLHPAQPAPLSFARLRHVDASLGASVARRLGATHSRPFCAHIEFVSAVEEVKSRLARAEWQANMVAFSQHKHVALVNAPRQTP